MKKRLKKLALWICLPMAMLTAFGFADNYFEISKNLEIFTSLYRELNIYYVDETQPGTLMKNGIDAMLKSLDPYTVYYPESKIEDYRFMTTGSYGGIGALISSIDGKVVISEPYQDFPAYKAGLMAGDVITHIDGQEIKGKTQSEISDVLKGQAGTSVSLTIERAGSEVMVKSLTREEVQIPDVPYAGMLDEQTAYVKLSSFTETAGLNVSKAYRKLRDEEGAQRIVLDLRDNGGGLLREAVNIVNMFVPKGTEIVSTKGKIEEWNKSYTALAEPIAGDIPVIVLVNHQSASASEIVSGTIQDLDRGVIVGTNSYGKGLVQQTKDIAYNAKLKLTVAKYYTPSGRCIQRIDYSHRADDGGAEIVPDSLLSEFSTRNGRKVYDGRGIDPDVVIELEDMSDLLGGMLSAHVIFNYATLYRQNHPEISDPALFTLSKEEYADFVSYALAQKFEYNTSTELLFEELKKVAQAEKYYDDAQSTFDALYADIKPQKQADLLKFEDQIRDVLENEIVSRYYYQQGRIKNGLKDDEMILRALQVFDQEYENILLPK